MKLTVLSIVIGIAAMLTVGCSEERKSTDGALSLIDAAYKAKDYDKLLHLTDSLEKTGELLPSSANYWRGYACDRTKRKQEAVEYWKAAIQESEKSTDAEDLSNYVKAASHLSNILTLDKDYDGVLKLAQPVVERTEALKCDTTSDYANLLIYIGLCQITLGQSEGEDNSRLLRACEKHQQNIDRNHSDQAYKDAIAGMVNIAYYCVVSKKYEEALYYTRSFGDLLMEYENHTGIDSIYVDRQVGRYTIYKALALDNLGRKDEAGKTYEAFLQTKFSKSAEGIRFAEDYIKGNVSE